MDTERWYYRDGPQSVGPFLRELLVELARAGIVTPDTLVRREETDAWVSLSGVLQAEPSGPAPPPLPVVPTASDAGGSSLAGLHSHGPVGTGPHHSALTTTGDEDDDTSQQGWRANPVAPWRRWAARILDTIIHGFIGIMLAGYTWYVVAPISADAFFAYLGTPFGGLVDLMISSFTAAIVGAVVVGSTGSSVGKAVFGVQIVNVGGEPIGIRNALIRELEVWCKGLALGIPLISLITLACAYSKLKKQGNLSWDSRTGSIVLHRPDGNFQRALNVVGIMLIIAAFGAVKWQAWQA